MPTMNDRRAPRSRLAYRIVNQADDRAEILIYDEIGYDPFFDVGIAAEDLVRDLSEIEASQIDVRINSIGGVVFEGVAIYNALARHPAHVDVYIDGIAASIASVIAMAGDRIHIAANAHVMIHNPHGVVWGEAADMRKMADTLDKIRGSLVGTYARRTGQPAEKIEAWMDAETWFNAEEAVEFGFADEIVEGGEIDARIAACLTSYRNVPPALAALIEARAADTPEPEREPEPEPEPDQIEPNAPAGPGDELIRLAATVERTLYMTAVL
ncbi:MAG TPA: head maturation protease, ClpP-related [Longimicrobiales bacterium]